MVVIAAFPMPALTQDKPADSMQILRETSASLSSSRATPQTIGANTLSDAKAKKLIGEFLAIEKAEAGLKATCVPRLSKVLPQKKVMRYLQIENKIRAIVKYDLAAGVPLAE